MAKLPRISGVELIKVLERKGYTQMRTRGSHVRLYPPTSPPDLKKVTVPLKKELKTGTLLSILKDTGLTPEDLR